MKILLLEIDLTNKTGNNNMDEHKNVLEKLEILYDCIKLSAEEYVNVDNKLQIMDTLTKESVIRDIFKEQGLGKMALEVVKKYFEQLQFATEDDIYLL
ncbi:16963_t:CDS:2 [Cetraspora pellucida]|uniref:16963_t:CDS:1 n=1 Tax=Cetraspora pellucida TaxID=1433469 RepID=A0A9N9NZ08_9GLOM|nr:16963_t:CDS:2 [Cetraspora pellucida]